MPTAQPFTRRLQHTPLRDLLRGRLTGRLDWRSRLIAADLSEEAKQLIYEVTKRTRLWRLEQAAVADELLAHFADAKAAGTPDTDAVETFGNTTTAAKLIRRAKIRNRPLMWRAYLCVKVVTYVIILVYLVSAVTFFAGHPTIKVDYVRSLNTSVLAVPESEWAWPIYKHVLGELLPRSGPVSAITFASPDPNEQAIVESWLISHARAVADLREGTRFASVGFLIGPNGSFSPSWQIKLQEPLNYLSYHGPLDGSVIQVLLPQCEDLTLIGQIFVADTRLALRHNDPQRAEDNLLSLWRLADQMRHDGGLVYQHLVASKIRNSALQEMAIALPQLADDQLARIAAAIAGPRVAADLASYDGERLILKDLIQRTYTDDGQGDGRLAKTWISAGPAILPVYREKPAAAELLPLLAGTIGPIAGASRKDIERLATEYFDAIEIELRKPIRNFDRPAVFDRIEAMRGSVSDQIRYGPLAAMLPTNVRLQSSLELLLGRRDGLLVAIAAERFKRRTGNYPAVLAEIPTALLPAVPLDRITGRPLYYALRDGRPLIYSVGVDRDDDGGRPAHPQPNASSDPAASWSAADAQPADGDWVLYPRPDTEKK